MSNPFCFCETHRVLTENTMYGLTAMDTLTPKYNGFRVTFMTSDCSFPLVIAKFYSITELRRSDKDISRGPSEPILVLKISRAIGTNSGLMSILRDMNCLVLIGLTNESFDNY